MPYIKWNVRCDSTAWGQSVGVTGSFNSWNKTDPVVLSTTSETYPVWTASHAVEVGEYEYKYVIVGNDGELMHWETDTRDNRIVTVSASSTETTDIFGNVPVHASHHNHHNHYQHDNVVANNEHNSNRTVLENKFLSSQGQNHEAHSRQTSTDVSHLDIVQRALVEVTKRHQSWRLRLQFVRSLYTDPAYSTVARTLDGLVSVSIYLTLLSTGQVRCGEDGGHHRPNHHAHEARLIDMALSRIVYDPASAKYATHVIRRIMPHLPSYSKQFTVSVPLTRIRDIAHRSDIPKDLKLQIKHTLQNKLHRSAGPEDLYTSAAILERISHGGYSEPFVEQFRIFHDELKAFFNMSSLDERLQYLAHIHQVSRAIEMLHLKTSNASAFEQLKCLVEVRNDMTRLSFMQAAERNVKTVQTDSQTQSNDDDSKLPSEDVQKTRLADIDLESYAFVLLAALAKEMEQPHLRETSQSFPFAHCASILGLALQVVGQCQIEPEECNVIRRELQACSLALGSAPRSTNTEDVILRLRAGVDRASRFAREFSDAIVSVYTRQAAPLAHALGVADERAIAVLPEAEVRATVTFQASRIATAFSSACRKRLALPAWDVLHAGCVYATDICYVSSLGAFQSKQDNNQQKKTYVVVCGEAQGDEDIPTNVVGIVNGRPLPHLSHLGVRARQAGVVFVSADESVAFNDVWTNRISAGPVKLSVTIAQGLDALERTKTTSVSASNGYGDSNKQLKDKAETQQQVVDNQFSFDRSFSDVIDIREGTKARVSAKAYVAGLLVRIADESGGLFEAVQGMALPHGLFHAQREAHSTAYKALVSDYHKYIGDQSEKVADDLRAFIRDDFVIAPDMVSSIQKALTEYGHHVMVRSSANVEDLEKLSGAGLYDTVAAVPLDDADALQHAIRTVWASLWTRRAASSRRAYAVDDDNVSMAVLIQPMVRAHLSFVAFSYEPVVGKGEDIYIEMAVGMGETLASAVADGSPYRFKVNREALSVDDVALASYSQALVPAYDKDMNGKHQINRNDDNSGLIPEIVDYSTQRLTIDRAWRHAIVKRIAKTVLALEEALTGPQDVEGCIMLDSNTPSAKRLGGNDDKVRVFVVQARPQIIN